jgi:uncharacterized repeat protein (TIGR03803 family)
VFSLDLKTGKEIVLYSFCAKPNCIDGAAPETGVIEVKGTLYGTTSAGGEDLGTAYSLDLKTKKETVLYAFQGGSNGDGALPTDTLINIKGTLYGTTAFGAGRGCSEGSGCGTVFSVTP